MKNILAILIAASFICSGCATTQSSSTSSTQTAINDAWTAANALQTGNNGQLITPQLTSTVLSLTHNTGDAAYAAIVTSLINQIGGAVVAAQSAKVNPVSAVNAVLAPANVATTATAVVNGSVAP